MTLTPKLVKTLWLVGISILGIGMYVLLRNPATVSIQTNSRETAKESDAPSVVSSTYDMGDIGAYHNGTYGFTVWYPRSWKPSGKTVSNEFAEFRGVDSRTKENVTFYMFVRNDRPYEDLDAFLKELDASQGSSNIEVLRERRIVVNGLQGIEREEFLVAAGFPAIQSFLFRDGIVYDIGFHLPGAQIEDERDLYHAVLATFDFEKEAAEGIVGSTSTISTARFSSPYPISWKEGNITLDMLGVSLGEMRVPDGATFSGRNASGSVVRFASGENIYALLFDVSIMDPALSTQGSIAPRVIDMRRLLDEEGNMESQSGRTSYPLSSGAKHAYMERVFFVVHRDAKEFMFTTGGSSNVFFMVSVRAGGGITVQRVPLGGG